MSTNYFLVCDRCKAYVDFLRNPGETGTFMFDALTRVPRFVGCHEDHHTELRIVQEDDARSWTYTEYLGGPCEGEDTQAPSQGGSTPPDG